MTITPAVSKRILRSSNLLLNFVLLALLAFGIGCQSSFRVEETTIAQVHEAMKSGELTAQALVQMYLDRIEAYDKQGPFINSIILVNPKAMERAKELDEALATTGFVGSLHGIPIIIKDNYDTFDMPTSNGTLALKKSIPPDDAFQVRKLREAGAIILAKSNMAEFASSGAFTVSSVLPGYTRNPYDTTRTTAGSSGGTAAAIAANFATVGLGSDTGSSIRGPASHQSLVGFRTTMGLASRDGIAPLSAARDVGGPMARTVEDAVAVLQVTVGYDPADPVTERGRDKVKDDYKQFLDREGLQGARIGVLRQLFEIEDTGQEEQQEPKDTQEPADIKPAGDQDNDSKHKDPENSGKDQADKLKVGDEEESKKQQQQDENRPRKVHPEILRIVNQANTRSQQDPKGFPQNPATET